ncbi:PREDICTED: SH3 domain-binding glutamic acid-rich-like protein [Tinamus guttatus]|uniref:SH3 domain-binding glutamic acid-rich-like protein n=1 Tax=Tinamus guttatus TaxID=94827 RepID=UPI00052EE8DA|nr:PREDICTED: SH3 domain-binding glutamic acid-rich-like protein [Tinamus guttatus]
MVCEGKGEFFGASKGAGSFGRCWSLPGRSVPPRLFLQAREQISRGSFARAREPPPIKKQQQDVLGFLEANKIEFEEKDIAANEENRKWMRENVPEDSRPASGNPLPPRLFNDSRYLGDYEAFFEARENNAVYAFLGLTAPPGSKEAEALAKQQA